MKKYHILLIIFVILITIFVIAISNHKVNYMKGLIANIGKDQIFLVSNQSFFMNEQRRIIQSLNKELKRKQIVTVSFYHPESKGINSDSDPTNTAIMRKPVVGRTVAISSDLFDLGWLDGKVYLEGFGVFVAEDRMNSSVKGKQIDICVASEKQALRLGVKYNIIAVKLNTL